jgi:hypothetical protein
MAEEPTPPDCSTAPPDLEPLRDRTFAFYPPILNVEHNEWRFQKATWSELLVVNAKSEIEVWIPRRLLCGISKVDEPVMIVGLAKELEYKAGNVWPCERRLLAMPRTVGATAASAPAPRTASALSRNRAATTESRIGRLIAMVLGAVLLVCLVVLGIFRLGAMRPVKFTAADQDFLSLSRSDDYFSVVRKLGPPAADRWRPRSGVLQYRVLSYPQRGYSVVLLGTDKNDARYIGALDRNWQVVHFVDLAGGADTSSMLRGLPKF